MQSVTDQYLKAMSLQNWTTLQEVGDESEVVRKIECRYRFIHWTVLGYSDTIWLFVVYVGYNCTFYIDSNSNERARRIESGTLRFIISSPVWHICTVRRVIVLFRYKWSCITHDAHQVDGSSIQWRNLRLWSNIASRCTTSNSTLVTVELTCTNGDLLCSVTVQLLLDTSALKTKLLEIPVTASGGVAVSSVYTKIVLRELGKVEVLLKVRAPSRFDIMAIFIVLSTTILQFSCIASDFDIINIVTGNAAAIVDGKRRSLFQGRVEKSPTPKGTFHLTFMVLFERSALFSSVTYFSLRGYRHERVGTIFYVFSRLRLIAMQIALMHATIYYSTRKHHRRMATRRPTRVTPAMPIKLYRLHHLDLKHHWRCWVEAYINKDWRPLRMLKSS